MERRRDERPGKPIRKQRVLAYRAYRDLEKGMEQGGMYSDTEAEHDMYSEPDEKDDAPPGDEDPQGSDQEAIDREEAWLTLDEGISSPEPLSLEPGEHNPGTREIGLHGNMAAIRKIQLARTDLADMHAAMHGEQIRHDQDFWREEITRQEHVYATKSNGASMYALTIVADRKDGCCWTEGRQSTWYTAE